MNFYRTNIRNCLAPLVLLNIGYFILLIVVIPSLTVHFFFSRDCCGLENLVWYFLFVITFPSLNLWFFVTCSLSALFFRNKRCFAFVLYATDVIFLIVYPCLEYYVSKLFSLNVLGWVKDHVPEYFHVSELCPCIACFSLFSIGMYWVISFCLACIVSLFLKERMYQKINGVFSKIVRFIFMLFLLPPLNVMLCPVFLVSWFIVVIRNIRSDFCIRASEQDPS